MTSINKQQMQEMYRAIAFLLGYRVETRQREWEDLWENTCLITDYVILDKTGREVTYWRYGAPNDTLDKAWQHARIPFWPLNAEQALELLPVDASVTRSGSFDPRGEWECAIPKETGYEYPEDYIAYADTPALAICLCYLEWKKEQ